LRNGDREGQALVEHGRDVVIPALIRSRGSAAPTTPCAFLSKVLTAASTPMALQRPALLRRARNIEEGGSLTIIATALMIPAAAWTR